MGGASRFVMLLTTPFPILLHRRPRVSLLRLARLSSYSLDTLPASPHHLAFSPRSRPQLGSPVSSSQQIHTQTSSDTFREDRDSLEFAPNPPAAHPWPEWSKLIDTLSAGGYFDHQRLTAYEGQAIRAEDEFVAYEEFSDEFVRASSACLAFARDRPDLLGSLSTKDIGVLVENGTAYLFRSALDTSGRMRAFLGIGTGNTLETEKVHLVDLMKYLLSYASNPTVASKRSNPYCGELVESSVRYLLSELAMLARGAPSPQPIASVPHQFPDNYGQPPRPLGQKIEMKRGDWICSRCGFMNFARNVKCLECEEARPKRQLTGGEWECPQCDFYNYGRNVVCLRCDCKRPEEASFGTTPSSSGWGNGDGIQANKPDIDSRLAANEEKAQRWFSKVSQLDSNADLSSAAADEDFPEIMPLRKGVNRFVVSTRKTPLERRLANSQYQRNLGNADSQTSRVNAPLSRSLDEILGRTSAVSDADNNVVDGQGAGTEDSSSSSFSPQYGHGKANKSSFVPFVPLPADKFAKKPQKIGDNEPMLTERFESVSSRDSDQTSTASVSNESGKSVDNWQQFVKPSDLAEGQDKEKEQAGKSERWFNKITELHDVTDVTSISDGFPEIMPVRKGENCFVVSKKKDRSLTSPIYKRTAAMEQTGNTNFVPFVPFPPDYFAKKNKQQPNGADSTPASEISTGSAKPEKSDENKYRASDVNHLRKMENEQNRAGKLSLESSRENSNNRVTGNYYGSSIRGNSTQNSFTSQSYNQDAGSTGFSGKETRSESSTNLTGNSQQQADSNIKSGWTGESLEGSAVQEPDPLDMSEEAKAQRWFRRVALIKDISELSQIPDEDFPSIMPMRKGVNRFVVSKRKTPLERRLTSPQYRRNLPVVRSDPVKKENENS